ncbi:predicted protein [Streptomyces viridosporus ATCC 14672]|uniref:Predicted protein n=1 Tax=Streptomyces viridosporus (strain ATCC 14672 / DSM 40746 / JCM 4963 / KCTC 9882 / NRRL B-12104 / FH 1290) TaxID=566461 RepID=D5ZXK9_STRV1|nr:predicted protein [Streptomyces viridosporus ATCC 14672]
MSGAHTGRRAHAAVVGRSRRRTRGEARTSPGPSRCRRAARPSPVRGRVAAPRTLTEAPSPGTTRSWAGHRPRWRTNTGGYRGVTPSVSINHLQPVRPHMEALQCPCVPFFTAVCP